METCKVTILVNGQVRVVEVRVYEQQIIRSTVCDGFADRYPFEYVVDYVQRILSKKFTVLMVESA